MSTTHYDRLNEIITYLLDFLDKKNSRIDFDTRSQSFVFIHYTHGRWFKLSNKLATALELEEIKQLATDAWRSYDLGYVVGYRKGQVILQDQLRNLLGIESNDD